MQGLQHVREEGPAHDCAQHYDCGERDSHAYGIFFSENSEKMHSKVSRKHEVGDQCVGEKQAKRLLGLALLEHELYTTLKEFSAGSNVLRLNDIFACGVQSIFELESCSGLARVQRHRFYRVLMSGPVFHTRRSSRCLVPNSHPRAHR